MPNVSMPKTKFSEKEVRRRSIVMAYLNAALWGIGNGLAGTTLVFYLANEYEATGSQLSWILAAPALVGVLRLLTPLWMDQVGSRKRFCIRMFFGSALILLGLPLMSAPGFLPEAAHSIAALIVCWACYHLFEHFGVVALWSWFGDLVPSGIRGRFVGRRSGWMSGGRVVGIIIAATVTTLWRNHLQSTEHLQDIWQAYATLASSGAALMMVAIVPLRFMTDPASPSEVGNRIPSERWREILNPFLDKRFRRLLYYSWWFSFANGITDTAIRIYQVSVLQLTFAEKRILDSSSRGIQSFVMPWAGIQADRHGNVIVLVISQALVSAALLFLLPATAEAKWWVVGTYVLWIAYAGANVAMPNLLLQLSEPQCSAAYSAAWFSSTQLVYAVSALLGGRFYEFMQRHWHPPDLAGWQIDHFAALILLGWGLRSAGIFWALRIRER